MIYIDADFKCHTSNPDGIFREVETDFFDGRCATFIEGYRCIPPGEGMKNSDGVAVHGISPWRPLPQLVAAQAQYEADQAQLAAAYQEGVNSV